MCNNNNNTPNKLFHFDSSNQLFSDLYNDVYFSSSGAEAESEHVFIDGNNLKERFSASRYFTIAEVGFGTGLNLLKTIKEWEKFFIVGKKLTYFAFEAHPLPPSILVQAHNEWPTLKDFSKLLINSYTTTPTESIIYELDKFNVTLKLIVGDINKSINQITTQIDCWFLDGFSPAKNPQMWSDLLFHGMKQLSKPGSTTFATYSCAKAVREGLIKNSFKVSKIPGFGNKKHMLRGMLSKN